ncbi:MAG: hypothetical protein M1832_001460 [Thelocarpon impressellum]|nr:MAG: hypothetical protein M1832_001460 [Thelocarpon impressellum]
MVEVTLGTPLAEALSSVIQPKLVEVGWSTGGVDDSALSEYIILMLVNGKTQEQIAAELSGDLLQLGPDDPGAVEFSRWLFDQVEVLHRQSDGGQQAPPAESAGQMAGSGAQDVSHPGSDGSRTEEGDHADIQMAQDTDMGDGSGPPEVGVSVSPSLRGMLSYLIPAYSPTGPKSMRGNRDKRLFGQLSKAMDRSGDAVLHRVRADKGSGRVSTHSREPPKGPRNAQNRNQRMPAGRGVGPMQAVGAGPNPALAHMTTQQQMQLFAMYEEQARMMSQILSPQQQQMFMGPGAGGPMTNGGFGHAAPQGAQQPGRSLFERVESNPQRPTGAFGKRPNPAAPVFHSKVGRDQAAAPPSDADPSSSMEVESSQATEAAIADTMCKFNLACAKADCAFAHQSPAAPPGMTVDVHDHCSFGAACKNRKCVARHPSPATKVGHQAEQDCKFFPNCTNKACPFRHPTAPLCRNGADCTRSGCTFTHVKTECKYNPCLNPACAFKHVKGQKRGAFDDKVWSAGGAKEGSHVSERKFVDENMAEEELIVPGAAETSLSSELVT